jgi:hypothetical protein
MRSVLTEIYLCHACSCHEIEEVKRPQAICSYALHARQSAVWMSPRDWDFQGSNDGVLWVTVTAVRGEAPWTALEKRTYQAGISQFRHYRLLFLASALLGSTPGTQVALQEVDLMGPHNECISNPLEFETAAPTATTDRQCGTARVCTALEYETAAPTATTNRNCTALTVCGPGMFEDVPPTATADRGCRALTQCASGTYESVLPTATTDRVCEGIPANTMEAYRVYADALGVRWTQPTINRVGYPLLGFRVFINDLRPASRRCTDAGRCTYTPADAATGAPQSCGATDGPAGTNLCGAVPLPGTCSAVAHTSKPACLAAGGVWTPSAGNAGACAGAGACTYVAQSPPGAALAVAEACEPADLAACAGVDFGAPFHDSRDLHPANDFSRSTGCAGVSIVDAVRSD